MERIFYRTECKDQETELPIYVFDTSYLPSPNEIDYDLLIIAMMSYLPESPYVLVMFSCGLNKISWVWGIKFLKTFLADSLNSNVENLRKVITVHDSWFVKTLTQIVTNFNITKKGIDRLNNLIESFGIGGSSHKRQDVGIVTCSSLGHLNEMIDIRRMKISLNVYLYDYQLDNRMPISTTEPPLISSEKKLDVTINPLYYHHFFQIFNILYTNGDHVELLLHKPGNKLKSEILLDCINRNQLIWINDWDLNSIATFFKKFLNLFAQPLIPIDYIDLPMSDDFEYTLRVFDKIMSDNSIEIEYKIVLLQMIDLCHKMLENSSITKHTSQTLSKALSHSLSQQVVSAHNKDKILIVTRFFKNLLTLAPTLLNHYEKFSFTIDEMIQGGPSNSNIVDESYLNYDITQGNYDSDSEDSREILFQVLPDNEEITEPVPKPLPKQSQASNRKITPDAQKTLNDISNLVKLRPAGEYKLPYKLDFSRIKKSEPKPDPSIKKPVIRGRKVGELAKLFEERVQGFEILQGM